MLDADLAGEPTDPVGAGGDVLTLNILQYAYGAPSQNTSGQTRQTQAYAFSV